MREDTIQKDLEISSRQISDMKAANREERDRLQAKKDRLAEKEWLAQRRKEAQFEEAVQREVNKRLSAQSQHEGETKGSSTT